MRGYLLDTHIWIWYLIASERLPESIRSRIDDAASRLWLSPISLWELCVLVAKRRIELDSAPRRWVTQALDRFPLHEAPLNFEVALRSREVDLPHPDPADAFLASTTLVFDLVLLTADRRLSDLKWLPTFSG